MEGQLSEKVPGGLGAKLGPGFHPSTTTIATKKDLKHLKTDEQEEKTNRTLSSIQQKEGLSSARQLPAENCQGQGPQHVAVALAEGLWRTWTCQVNI